MGRGTLAFERANGAGVRARQRRIAHLRTLVYVCDMTYFTELASLLEDSALDEVQGNINRHVPETAPVLLDRAVLARGRAAALRADAVISYMDDQAASNATAAATQAKDQLLSLTDSLEVTFRQRESGIDHLNRIYMHIKTLVAIVTPYASALEQERIVVNEAKLRTAVDGLEAVRKRAAEALAAAQEAAAIRGSSALSSDFDELAKEHRRSARYWLGGTFFAASAVAALALYALLSTDGTAADFAYARILISKLSLGFVFVYGLYFCSRNYRVHRHLATEYRSRSAVLAAAQALRASVDDADSKSIVMQTAVLTALSVPATGLLKTDTNEDQTMAAVLAAIAARAPRAG